VTIFGLLFTPVFYIVSRGLGDVFAWRPKAKTAPATETKG